MKILLTTDMYKPAINGVITSTATLKKGLEERGHEVRILTLGKNSKIDVAEDAYYLSSIGVGKIYPGARVTLASDRDYFKDILCWQPDIIHSQTEFSTFYMAKYIAKHLDIPIVHTYHTLYEDYTHYFSPSKTVGKKVVKSFSRVILNSVGAVIAPTEKVGKLLQDYDIDSPVTIIPTGIDLQPFLPQQNDDLIQAKIRTIYNIPQNAKVLLFLGRLAKEKNVQEILAYLSRLETTVDYRFMIVGDGPYRKKLEELSAEYHLEDKVIFTGMIDNTKVGHFYKLADVFTSASTSETQGLTYIEAFAAHTPGLCRKDDVLSHVLQDGVTGYQYTNQDDFERLFNHLMLNDAIRENLGQNAQTLAVENYSSQSFAEAVESIYQMTIDNSYVYAN